MPFGITSATAAFQALLTDFLRDFLNQFVFVYLDDILIFSSSHSEHVFHLRRVPQRFLKNKLFVKGEKCKFHSKYVNSLGYIIEGERRWTQRRSRQEQSVQDQRLKGFWTSQISTIDLSMTTVEWQLL